MIIIRIQHHEVPFLSHLYAADAAGTIQGGGAVQGKGGNGLLDTHLHIDASQCDSERDGTGEATAGIKVGGQCYGTAGVNHLAPAGIRFFQGKGGKREQGGNHAFVRHGMDVGIGSVQQVVGGYGGKFRSQSRTAQRHYFIGMELQRQSHITSGSQQAAGLPDGEHALLAKDIAKLCQPVLNDGGHHFANDEIHIIVRTPDILLRHCMCAKKSGNDVHPLVLVIVQAAHDAEVNVKLLQSDFSIDTAPMEQLIEALRRAEAEVADKYFPNDADAVAKYETYTQTVQVTNELPGLPVSVLGPYSLKQKVSQETVAEFHSEGKALQTAYTEANERYETLMTAPRRDLGDSIRKAFSNVDDILTDMSLDKTLENQRAVRILAYNRMEITAENIERVKEADKQVTAVIEKLTPKNVLQMIRDGVNPLEKTFGELESYFAENPQSYEEEAEDYSRFLYQLEQKKDITENERKAYIGIYRMVHQIEREDGAAVGAVVNTGAELQFSTLLAASRSRRTSHMDWKVSDDTGLTQEVRLSENNISEQISVGMAKEILTDVSQDTESRDAYYQECLQQMREAVETEPGAAQMLERGEVNTSTSNLLAAQALLEDPAELFSDLQRYRKKYNKEKEIPVAATGEEPAGTEASGLWEQLDQQNFADDYRTMLQDALQETETISLEQAESHLDVKQLQLVHKQLRLAGNLQNRQEYFLPMYLGDQLAGVHLTLQQGAGETSAVDIRVDAGDEQLEAHLQVNGEHIEGYLVGNTPEEVTKLEKTSDIFLEWIQTDTSADWKAEKLSVVSSRDMTRMAAGETQNAETIESRADAAQLYRLAKGFLQAVADSSGK